MLLCWRCVTTSAFGPRLFLISALRRVYAHPAHPACIGYARRNHIATLAHRPTIKVRRLPSTSSDDCADFALITYAASVQYSQQHLTQQTPQQHSLLSTSRRVSTSSPRSPPPRAPSTSEESSGSSSSQDIMFESNLRKFCNFILPIPPDSRAVC